MERTDWDTLARSLKVCELLLYWKFLFVPSFYTLFGYRWFGVRHNGFGLDKMGTGGCYID